MRRKRCGTHSGIPWRLAPNSAPRRLKRSGSGDDGVAGDSLGGGLSLTVGSVPAEWPNLGYSPPRSAPLSTISAGCPGRDV